MRQTIPVLDSTQANRHNSSLRAVALLGAGEVYLIGLLLLLLQPILSTAALLGAVGAGCFSLAIMVLLRDKLGGLLSFGPVLAAFVFLFTDLSGFGNGVLYLIGQWIGMFNTAHSTDLVAPVLSGTPDPWRLGIVPAVLSAWFVRLILDRHSPLLCALTAGAVVLLLAAGGVPLSLLGATLLLLSLVCIWQNQFSGATDTAALLPFWGLVAALVGIGVLLSMRHGPSARLAQLRQNVRSGWTVLRYGEDTLPGGDLTRAYAMKDGRDDTLLLTFDTPQQLYLRGFVGSHYLGDAWKEQARADYTGESAGMMDWLAQQGFRSQYQNAAYQQAADTAQIPQSYVLSVKNNGAVRKYIYLPYGTQALDDDSHTTAYYDWQLRGRGLLGQNRYQLTAFVQDTPTEAITIEQDTTVAPQYADAELVYRTFVYNHYLEVPQTAQALVQDTFWAGTDWETGNVSVYEATRRIRMVLQSEVTFRDGAPALQPGGDYLSEFLETEKAGNAAAYATAAVLAYRAMGIPARYVEGYHVTTSQVERLQATGETELQLTDRNAHAWAEVYLDQMGWMPVEVVPGYYNAGYVAQQLLGIPDSTISVAPDESTDRQGTTTEALAPEELVETAPETLPQKVIHLLGIAVFVLLIAAALLGLISLQRVLRRKLIAGRKAANAESYVRQSYQNTHLLLKRAGIEIEPFPEQAEAEIQQRYPTLPVGAWNRYLRTVQNVLFGTGVLSEKDRNRIETFNQSLLTETLQQSTALQRLILLYWDAL